jgi:hypothetical protein
VDPLTEARYTLRVRDGSGAVKVRTVAARNAAAAIARIEAEGFTLVALVTDDMNRFDQPIGNAGLTLTAWSKLRYTIRMGGLLRLLLMVVAAVGALVLLVLGSSAAQPTSGLVGLALLIMVPAISLWAKARPSPSALLQSAIHAFTRGDFTAAARDASKHVAAARALGYGALATGVGNLVIALAKAGRREEAEAAIRPFGPPSCSFYEPRCTRRSASRTLLYSAPSRWASSIPTARCGGESRRPIWP